MWRIWNTNSGKQNHDSLTLWVIVPDDPNSFKESGSHSINMMSVMLTQVWPVFQSFKGERNGASEARQAQKRCQINIKGGLMKQVNAESENLASVGQFQLTWDEWYYTPGKNCVLSSCPSLNIFIQHIQRTRHCPVAMCFPPNLFVHAYKGLYTQREDDGQSEKRRDNRQECRR